MSVTHTMDIFSGMMEVETDWSRLPALSRREVRCEASPGSFSGAGVGMVGDESCNKAGYYSDRSIVWDSHTV